MALFAPEDGAPTQSTVLPSDVLNSVKRIKNRCASYRQHPYRIVGRLREASRQKHHHRWQNWSLWYPGALPGGESPYGCMPM
nr:hypothetical protein [Methylomarinum sp. Ch1-1]MDP4519718.1 hypothetical protein [Methylomarinum sp. Ch1-1]